MAPPVVDGKFTRGLYKGKAVDYVVRANPRYIQAAWCSGSEHFGILRRQYEDACRLEKARIALTNTLGGKVVKVTDASIAAAFEAAAASEKEAHARKGHTERHNCGSMRIAVTSPTHPVGMLVGADYLRQMQVVADQFDQACKDAGFTLVDRFHDEVVLSPARECVLGREVPDEEGLSFLEDGSPDAPGGSVGSFLDGL